MCTNETSAPTLPKAHILPQPIPPSTPSLLSPTNGDTISSGVTLRWTAESTATRYELWVAFRDTANFGGPVSTDSTYYFYNFPNAMDFYWKVRAINGAGSSSFTTVWKFTTYP